MTVKELKEALEQYPDNMPIEIITFHRHEGDEPPASLDIEDISGSEIDFERRIKRQTKILQILVG